MHGVQKKYREMAVYLSDHKINVKLYANLGKIRKLHIFFRGLQIDVRQTAIIRHNFMDPILFLNILLSKLVFDRTTILEHHSDHRAELRARGRVGSLLCLMDEIFTKFADRWVDGHIMVSAAVATRQAYYFKHGKSVIIENGSSIMPNKADISLKNYNASGKKLKLVMMASSFCQWHGLDRLVSIIGGSDKVSVIIIGDLGFYKGIKLPNNFHAIGLIRDDRQLQEILSSADVAVDSLRLSSIGLTESSSLKSREYIAKCKPLVCEYLPAPEWAQYSLLIDNLSNDDHLIEWYQGLDLGEIYEVSEKLFFERFSFASVAMRYKAFISEVEDRCHIP